MLFQGVKQGACKAEIALHKLLRILRTVDTCKIEDEIGFGTEFFKQLRLGVDVIFENLIDFEFRTSPVFSVLYVFECRNKIFTDKSCGTGYKNFHFCVLLSSFWIYSSEAIFALVSSTVSSFVLCELNSVRVFLSVSPLLKYLS